MTAGEKVTYVDFMNHSTSRGHRKPVPTTWAPTIATYINWLTASGQSKNSVRLRRKQLERLGRSFKDQTPWELTLEDLTEWLAEQDWTSDTLRSHRGGISGLYRWGRATGRIDTDPTAALPSVKQKRPRPRPIPESIVSEAILEAGEREALMIRVARHLGLRSCEIAVVHSEDLVQDLLGWSLVVHGKGGHERVVPIEDPLLVEEIRDAGGWCFPGLIGGHLSPARVSELLCSALPSPYTGHQLRHTFASMTYQRTGDIRVVQELLGHASLDTTQIYTAVPSDRLRAAVAAGSGRRSFRTGTALAA